MAISLSFSPYPLSKLQNPNPKTPDSTPSPHLSPSSSFSSPKIPPCNNINTSKRREFILKTATAASLFVFSVYPFGFGRCFAEPLSGIANTKSWFQFYGDGFAIRVPPQFQDITEPEDFNAGMSLYGDKAKPKTFAARFASPDGSEVVSVVIRPSNQLKITFLEAQDITDLGSLKEVAKIFVPGGATLYSARTIKIKEDDNYRTYYFYEFSRDEQHVALVAAVNSGKTFIAGSTAPRSKWDNDGVRLRSAAISLTVL